MLKSIKKILFHRITFVALAMIIQMAFIVSLIFYFKEYTKYFYAFSIALSTIVVLYIIYNTTNPAFKIAWIIPILLFPIFGGIFFLFFGNTNLNKKEREKMDRLIDKLACIDPPDDAILDKISQENPDAGRQATYIQKHGGAKLYQHTATEYFPVGELKFERLKEELNKAKHYIFMEYFIIEEGLMWNSLLDILKKKAAEGVDVRLIYDDAGCLFTLPSNYPKKLESMGIKCCVFNKFRPILNMRLNNRDHRKIACIDGHTAFTGGLNLADEYINAINKYGHWKDTAIMLKGEAAWSLTTMFLGLWSSLRNVDEDFSKYKALIPKDLKYETDGYVQPFTDSPLDDEIVGEIVYLNLINKAKKYVYITTPYLIIDHEMITALSTAAKSGVDVRIITPYHGDAGYVHTVTRSYYPALIEAGVKIYEYEPGYIHAKTYVVDGEYGVVGTINMDYRSLYLHFECAVWLYKNSAVKIMRDDYLKTLEVCKEIKLDEQPKVPWYMILYALVLRAFAPLM